VSSGNVQKRTVIRRNLGSMEKLRTFCRCYIIGTLRNKTKCAEADRDPQNLINTKTFVTTQYTGCSQ